MLDEDKLKSLFETPKKTRLTVICLLVTLATLGAVIAYIIYSLQGPGADIPPPRTEAVSGAPTESDEPTESDGLAESEAPPTQVLVGIVPSLTIDEARGLALADAGVSESEAEVTREALAQDNGIWVYEFRFRTEQAQYEYKLNANTGDVRSLVKEAFGSPNAGVTETPAPESAPPAETAPQPSTALQPVQSAAPTASQPPATPAPTSNLPTSTYIGMDRAKAIALDHAGLSASQVRFTHASMDRENGTMVYVLEFRQGQTEYEYEIDAATGNILDYERDED